jgi:biotin transport system substrate-specific component
MSTTAPALAAGRVPVLADSIPGDRVRDAVLIVTGALFTGLMAQVIIPMTPVPMTGQTLAVGLVGATLGMRRGVLSMVLYVLLGFLLPIYADGGSGVSHLWTASGGYLIGFILAAGLIGYMAEHGADRSYLRAFTAFVLAQLLIFIPGLLVLHAVTDLSWSATIHGGFTVFIVGGIVKALIGAAILPSTWRLVNRREG